jgi:hypothetical protein
MSIGNKALHTLRAKYLYQQQQAEVNLENLLANPAGIGEHSDIITEADKWIKQIAEASHACEVVDKILCFKKTY